MGGCRCTYRNCSLRTDGKTHMFHYPVFDKVRCHQWLTNAHKLEFLNLKVSQLKNRVVCQHHFKDENFMNFKKDKLTFDAVPTEDGPYCDSSHLDEAKAEQDDPKVFSISLDDIENEYLTIVDKKANFSVKYGDFLTNCDLMELDALNSLAQVNDKNQIDVKDLCELDSNPSVPKDIRKVRRTRRRDVGNSSKSILNNNKNIKNAGIRDKSVIDNNITNNNKESETRGTEDVNSVTVNLSVVPIEYDKKQLSDQNQQNVCQPIELNVFDEPKNIDQNEVNIFQLIEEPAFGKTNDQNQVNISHPIEVEVFHPTYDHNQLNIQPTEAQVLHETTPVNQDQNMHQPTEVKIVDTAKPPSKSKIRIISHKKIIPGIGKLEPISPTSVLPIPNKKKSLSTKQIQEVPAQETPEIQTNKTDNSNKNIAVEPRTSYSILKPKSELIDKSPNGKTHNPSIIKNKIPAERVAAIAEKRKFNMKLRDIIEDCLDKLDENDKPGHDNIRKQAHNNRILDSKKGQVCNYLARDPQLPSFQEYTIAYLEARMKKMENNLLNKIEENSQKIGELKQTYGPSVSKKSVHTQTSVNEDVHKKQLYHELSKYLSKEANSLIYEELFINKYVKDLPKSNAKKRKCR